MFVWKLRIEVGLRSTHNILLTLVVCSISVMILMERVNRVNADRFENIVVCMALYFCHTEKLCKIKNTLFLCFMFKAISKVCEERRAIASYPHLINCCQTLGTPSTNSSHISILTIITTPLGKWLFHTPIMFFNAHLTFPADTRSVEQSLMARWSTSQWSACLPA